MARNLIKLLFLSLLVCSCEKNELYVDPDYPTTINKLPEVAVSQIRTSLLNSYPYLHSTVNAFGFCYPSENDEGTDPPQSADLLTEAEAVGLAKDFITDRPSVTGVVNPGDLSIAQVYPLSGGIHWVVVTSSQKADTVEVLGTGIVFRFKYGELVNCEGNWYPEIYIPARFNFNRAAALERIVGTKVTHHDIGGNEYFVTITRSAAENSTTDLMIVPLPSDDKIELRLAWKIYLPEVSGMVYLDVMTGEIIRQHPTIIT